jgi:hypothetical protein
MNNAPGRPSSSGTSAPRAAPPAPSMSTRRPASTKPWLRSMSLTTPTPSKFSAVIPSQSILMQFDAPACCARSVRRSASAKASSLNGAVMLKPRPPLRAEALDHCGEAVLRRLDRLVRQVLARLAREGCMDERRLAVAHRVAEDGVAVRHRICPTACMYTGFTRARSR